MKFTFGLVIVYSTSLALLWLGCESQTLTYALTIRDFLPRMCSLVHTDTNQGKPFIIRAPSSIDKTCPYISAILNGTISGHPDFQRARNAGGSPGKFYTDNLINGSRGYLREKDDLGRRASLGNPVFEPTLRDYIEIADSGIPKPSYCASNSVTGFNGELRCGAFYTGTRPLTGPEYSFMTSNKEYFDMWFNDDIKYNRRIGVNLNLFRGARPGEFIFNSAFNAENSFNPVLDNFFAPHNHLKFDEASFPDPLTVPNWPKQDLLDKMHAANLAAAVLRRSWHTTEIHTFFKYTQTEKFDFIGDDDVWVFINGRLAIDLGGIHGAQLQFMDLSRQAAAEHFNLTVGETYTFDMFQAERAAPGSNFLITTTLAAPCNAANENNSKKQFDSSTDLNKDEVKTSRNVVLNDDGSFLLTQRGFSHSTSYLWVNEPINVGTGFVINFDFTVTDSTEGFAFVLHRRPDGLRNLPLSGGGNLGFKGLTNSLAIAFDLCRDRKSRGNQCKDQRVSVHTPRAVGDPNGPSDRTLQVKDSVMLSLKDSRVHHVKLDYFVTPPALEVTLDGSLYLRVMPIDPREIFQSLAAFAGFTATTSDSDAADVTISNFTVYAVDVESSNTVTVDFPNDVASTYRKKVLADGIDNDGFSIQTRDGCKSNIAFGGRKSNTEGLFLERINPATGVYHNGSLTPRIIRAQVVDDNTGKYKYALQTMEEGLYSLYVYYGSPGMKCSFDISMDNITQGGVSMETVNVSVKGSSNCFFASVMDAVEAVPLTNSPTQSPTALRDFIADDTEVFVAAIGGGLVVTGGIIAAILAIVYKRKWNNKRMYVEPGSSYKKDGLQVSPRTQVHSETVRDILATRASIIRERANRGKRMAAVTQLQNEQDELQEELAKLKRSVEVVIIESIPT